MMEFCMRPEGGVKAETTLISFVSQQAFLEYVKHVGEVRITFERETDLPILLVPNG